MRLFNDEYKYRQRAFFCSAARLWPIPHSAGRNLNSPKYGSNSKFAAAALFGFGSRCSKSQQKRLSGCINMGFFQLLNSLISEVGTPIIDRSQAFSSVVQRAGTGYQNKLPIWQAELAQIICRNVPDRYVVTYRGKFALSDL